MCLPRLHRFGRLAHLVCLGACWGGAASTAKAGPTAAQPSARLSVALAYTPDPSLAGCPSEGEFRGAVIQQLGYDPFCGGAAQHVVAEVKGSERALEARLAWTDASGREEGERRLAALDLDCGKLAKAMTFAVAVQIQLLATESAAPAPPVPAARLAGGAPAEEIHPRDRRLAIGVGPVAQQGVTPSTSGGLRAAAVVGWAPVTLELAADVTLPSTLHLADGSGFSATALEASVASCERRGRVALCAVGALGLLRAHGFGVDDARVALSWVGRAGLRVALEQPVARRWSTSLHADVLATLTPRTVDLNDVAVWTTPRIALGVGIDLDFHLR